MSSAETSTQPSSAAAQAEGQRAAADQALDAAAQALFRLGRTFSRHPMHRTLQAQTGQPLALSHILVTQAVAEAQAEPGHAPGVGAVADQLSIDPSTASRLVAETIQAGYLARTAAPHDGRRLHLTLTDAGRALVEQALRYQRGVFEQLTQAWPEHERLEFARLFARFAQAVIERYPEGK